jgi:acyl-CoA thioesterase FadM
MPTTKVVTCVSELNFVVLSGVCITTDVDTLLYHMNNARYLRELDFARVDFYERTGLYKKIRQKGGAVVQGACTIRYRRFVRPFSVFKITSKVSDNGQQASLLLYRKGLPENVFKNTEAKCLSYD